MITMTRIRQNGSLSCGVVVPRDFVRDATENDNLVGMSVNYCHAFAAALFIGNSEAMIFSTFDEPNGTIFCGTF